VTRTCATGLIKLVDVKAWIAVVVLSLSGACSTPGWDGRVESWGTMRAVMRDGDTRARISVAEVTRVPGTIGVGALEGLQGEIAVFDGVPWIARVEGDHVEFGRGTRSGDQATLLALAVVRRWKTIPIDKDLAAADVDALLATAQRDFGLGQRPWPFVIEGELFDVEAHVLHGQCPEAGAVAPGHEPFRRSFASVRGRLVGFYAPNSVGELVHHGQMTHVHVIVEEPDVYVGHVDSASVRGGAWLRVPAVD
jgi:alpha-acetolactate decarboxylase